MALVEVSCGVIFQESHVFVCRRKPEKSLGGYWEFPGGKVESHETGEECLVRELREELGIEVAVREMLTTSAHQYEHMAIMLTAYLCDLVSYDGTMADHDQYRWMRPEDLLSLKLAPADIPVATALQNINHRSTIDLPSQAFSDG